MKNFLIGIITTFSLVSITFADIPDEKLHSCLYPTVKLEIVSGGCGTGLIVKSYKNKNFYTNVILTAQHILTNGEVVTCVPKFKDWSTFTGYDKYKCVVFKSSAKYDMAIIIFESNEKMPVAELDFDTKFFIGSKIFKFGYGLTDECRFDRGEITSIKMLERQQGHIRINAHTIFGDSGGPCYLESNCKVIGITRNIRGFKENFVYNQTYLCPINWLKLWDAECNNELNFVIDPAIQMNLSMIEIQRKNSLLNLKFQIETLKQEIESKKMLEENLKKELEKMEKPTENSAPIFRR